MEHPFKYQDGKGKNKSCMDMVTGESECTFTVHKKLPANQQATLHLANKIAETTVTFNVPGPYLTLVVTPANAGTTYPAQNTPHMVVSNASLNINANANDKYMFSQWFDTDSAIVDDIFSHETSVRVTGSSTITAAFAEVAFTNAILELTIVPHDRGTITPAPGMYSYPTGMPISISASPLPGYHFDRWYGTRGAMIDDVYADDTTVIITNDASINAFFETNSTHELTLTIATDGNGTTTPLSGNHTVIKGWQYSLSATPNDGYSFLNWEGSDDTYIANAAFADTTVILSNDATVTANFILQTTTNVVLRVNAMGSGTTHPVPGAYSIPKETPYQVIAQPDSSAHFIEWTAEQGIDIASPSALTTTVSCTDSGSVIAHFAENSAITVACEIAVSMPGSGSTFPAPGTHYVYMNEPFSISAAPSNGYYFAGWTDITNCFVEDTKSTETTLTPYGTSGVTALFSPYSSNMLFAGVQLCYATETDTVHLAWSEAVDENTPADAIMYHIYAAQTNAVDILYTPSALVTTVTGAARADISGLLPDTRYWFLVVAENASGHTVIPDEPAFVRTMAQPLELVSPVKVLTDIVPTPIRGSLSGCVFDGDYRQFFSTGDVVFVSIYDEPGGEPRRITRVYYSDYSKTTILETDPVALDEIIAEGDLNTHCVLTGLREVPVQDSNAVLQTMQSFPVAPEKYAELIENKDPFYVHPDGEFMMWETGPPAREGTEYDHSISFGYGIIYDYSLTFEPELNSETKWTSKWGPDRLDYAKVSIDGNFILELQSTYAVSGKVSVSAYRLGILEKTIVLKYAVGGVPVYQEIILSLNAAAYSSIDAMVAATAKATAKKRVTLGLEWERNVGYTPFYSTGFDTQFDLLFTNNINFTSYVSIYPRISTKFYKSVSLDVDFHPSFNVVAETDFGTPWNPSFFRKFDIYFQARGAIGGKWEMFSKTLAEYQSDPINLSDPYYFYSQPIVSNVPPTPTEPVDVDVGFATVAIGISNGVNNAVTADGINWRYIEGTVAADKLSAEVQWPAGAAKGSEGLIAYNIEITGDGFLGEYGTISFDKTIDTIDNSPMVTIGDIALENALREKMSFPHHDFISQYKMMWLPSTLYLTNKGISALGGMEYADNVDRLHLEDNSIGDFSPLAGMTDLYELHADRNGVSSSLSFSGLSVQTITLTENNLDSLSYFIGNSSLQSLDVRSNPLTEHTITNEIPRLQQQGVTVLYDN